MTRTLDGIGFDTILHLEWFRDPIVDAIGHDPRSTYVERFWLPTLGPSTTWLLRLFTNYLEHHPTGCDIDISETARSLGLGDRTGKHGPFLRSITRAVDFDMARIASPGAIAVRRLLPSLSPRHLARLPKALQREHNDVAHNVCGSAETMRRRGQQLALSLLQLGEGASETEAQLGRWRFHPALAHQCTTWAVRELGAHAGPTHPGPTSGGAQHLPRLAVEPSGSRLLETADQ